MHIRHANPATSTIGHDGVQYEAMRDGIFEVPDHVGEDLLQHAVWTRYRGEAPYSVGGGAAAEPESEPSALGIDWQREGFVAAETGKSRSLPAGVHPRSREGRAWLAGWDSFGVG